MENIGPLAPKYMSKNPSFFVGPPDKLEGPGQMGTWATKWEYPSFLVRNLPNIPCQDLIKRYVPEPRQTPSNQVTPELGRRTQFRTQEGRLPPKLFQTAFTGTNPGQNSGWP